MTAYQRDDGAEMVEYKPGRTIRRDVGIRLGLIAPEVRIGGARPAALAPAADPQPEPVIPPPLQPSHEDLVSVAPGPAAEPPTYEEFARAILAGVAASIGMTYEHVAADLPAGSAEALVFGAGAQAAREIVRQAATPARPAKPRPAKRSLSDILADADRGHRALRRKAKP